MKRERTDLERKFEELFETELPENYEVDVRVRDLDKEATEEPERRRVDGLRAKLLTDHCGSSTSSTLTMEFFVAVSEGAWLGSSADLT